jgi:plasmid stability protein
MAAISIRNLDKSVVDALKKRAAAAGRSMEEEARQTLENSVRQDKDRAFERMRELSKRIGRLKGPSSVEIIRKMRDERANRTFGPRPK